MIATLTKDARTKADNLLGKVGETVEIKVSHSNPTVAFLTFKSGHGRMQTASLARFFSNDFTPITDDTILEALLAAANESRCRSITGATVEPDGWDDKGMPSILLACCLI